MSAPGKRLAWWKGLSRGEVMFTLVAVLMLAGAIWWRLRPGHAFATLLGGLIIAVAVITGVIAAVLLRAYAGRTVIASACPACARDDARLFERLEGGSNAVPCGHCVAYLRLRFEDLQVTEEGADALDESRTPYRVHPKLYLPVAKRNGDRISFDMPKICSVCGSADAPYPRDIRPRYGRASSSGKSVVGQAASYALADGALGASRRHSSTQPTQGETLDLALANLTVRVCEGHQKGNHAGDPVQCDDGDLCFASYRYYKEFLQLNGIDGHPVRSST